MQFSVVGALRRCSERIQGLQSEDAGYHQDKKIAEKAKSHLRSQVSDVEFMNERKLTWTKDELNIDSPYNTYKNKGLPVGPICNPSKAAIKAALYPDESFMKEGYMYFCLANPETGETVFAKTLKEQNANQAKYEKLYEEYNKKIAGEGN